MRIVTIGDSHTTGYPGFDLQARGNIRSSYQYWLKLTLEKKYSKNIEILNLGLPGDTSEGILERTRKVLDNNDASEFDLFIINGGGNDWINNPIDYSFTLTNLIDTCNLVRRRGIPIILTSISPFGNEKIMQQLQTISNELNTLIANEKDDGIIYFDWFNHLYDSNSNCLISKFNSGDNEHLNIDGYQFIGEALSKYVVENI
jgi:lysophospholipase L1-like esterase